MDKDIKRVTPLQAQAQFFKRKMIVSRILGIFCCLMVIAGLAVYYLKLFNEWFCAIIICYSIATIFIANSFLQDIKVGNPWQRINGFCGILLYLFTIFLIVWGFVNGNLTVQF